MGHSKEGAEVCRAVGSKVRLGGSHILLAVLPLCWGWQRSTPSIYEHFCLSEMCLHWASRAPEAASSLGCMSPLGAVGAR